jgi:hypothetical protein
MSVLESRSREGAALVRAHCGDPDRFTATAAEIAYG